MTRASKWGILQDNVKVRGAAKIKHALHGNHPEIEAIAGRIQRLAREPLTLAVMGEFSAGKSSFLNRLLGRDLLPVSILPKTATLTRLVWGNQAGVEIDYRLDAGIVTKAATHAEFDALQRAAKVNDPVVMQELEQIQEVRVFVDHPLLRRLHLLDTPGFNHDPSMDEKSLAVVDAADILVWISDYSQTAKQSEIEQLRRLQERGKRVWLVINKGDVQVSDSNGHAQAVKTLGSHLQQAGFLDFFQTNEILLVSCRSRDAFWDGLFQQLVARLSERVLNTDMELSVTLIEDQWRRLGTMLRDEMARYQSLDSRYRDLAEIMRVESIVAARREELVDGLREHISKLDDAVKQRCLDAKAYSTGITALSAFAMECTRGSMDCCIRALNDAYAESLADLQREHLAELTARLDKLCGLVPPERRDLRREVKTLLDYYQLRLRRASTLERPQGHGILPALERAVEILDHVGIRFGPFSWTFTTQVVEEGVLSIGQVGRDLTIGLYRRLQLEAALLRDFEQDVERYCGDPALIALMLEIGAFCDSAEQRLCEANNLWGDIGAEGVAA